MIIRYLGQVEYQHTWEKMKQFTDARTADTPDEIWILEHPPVFTQGLAGKAEHLLNPGNIPVIQTDRGGQVTYHGPGQLVGYVLLDLVRMNIGIRTLVGLLEKSVINLLQTYGITAKLRENAPGVYVEEFKICSIGLKVRKGCTYHGIALNVSNDLSPFSRINPCGFQGLEMICLNHWMPEITIAEVAPLWVKHLLANLPSANSPPLPVPSCSEQAL